MVYRQNERSEKVRRASKARILRAARRLFSKRGYGETTMREIAEAAGTSIGNLYFYFRNKDELLGTLFRETRQATWKWIEEAGSEVPPGASRLAIAVYANFVRLVRADSDLLRIFILQGASPALSAQVVSEHIAHWRDLWLANFPDYPKHEVELAVTATMGATRRVIERSLKGELHSSPMETAQFIVRWCLRAVGISEDEIVAALKVAQEAIAESPLRTE